MKKINLICDNQSIGIFTMQEVADKFGVKPDVIANYLSSKKVYKYHYLFEFSEDIEEEQTRWISKEFRKLMEKWEEVVEPLRAIANKDLLNEWDRITASYRRI